MSIVKQTIREDVQATQAYVVAASDGMVKLDAMENPHELPENLRAELAELLKNASLNRYPLPTMDRVEAALRASTSIPNAAKVLFGNGSDELIDIIIRACCLPGDCVLSPVPTFVMYAVSAQWAHARFVGVDLKSDFSLDIPATLKAITVNQPKVIFLAYPNNPTGVALTQAEIVQIVQAAPGLVVVDEAYEAFAEHSFMPRLLEFPNVLVLRTLSKLGLAGIRLGYAVASQAWVEQLDKVRPPYNVNILTRIAAEFSLRHFDVIAQQTQALKNNRKTLADTLRSVGQGRPEFEVYDSHANFLLIRMNRALEVFESLKKQGILVKYLGKAHPLLQNCLRVTVSTEPENQQFLLALQQALTEIDAKVA